MKKNILLFMSAMALSLAISCNKEDNDPIIEFKDPHVLQALINSYGYDKNGDGRISQKEADVVIDINLPNSGIRSFDEISYFHNVKRISLSGNQLTSIDVSNNSLLETLHCKNNLLTTLDVSNNLLLKFLDCNNNQLTTLDVSNNLLLETLHCNNNLLTTLDVSSNVALCTLDISNNQLLTSIDLRNNTNLDRFYCKNNKLTVLDLSKNKLVGKSDTTNPFVGTPLQKLIISYYSMLNEWWKNYYKDIIEYVYN